jgi:two-component system sensor histidine kinase TctE
VARNVNQEKRFINDAAHQLRTPLAGLISQVELAQRENSDPVLGARLTKVRTGAERSAHLVHQLLTLARTETTARREPLDLAALARDVAREWTPRAVAAGVDLGFEGEEHRMVQGDALQLREAMANLIDNALRYTPRGSAVTLKVEADGERTRLLVEDNGPGLSEADMAHVFQRFWRASELPGGCGLGLAIVSEIARRHGGEATAENMQPHGLRITLNLTA